VGAAADAVTTVTRRMVVKRKIFRLERDNMLISFLEPAFSSMSRTIRLPGLGL
jgi:hypothetical protein